MRRRQLKLTAVMLAATLLASNVAYADITLAPYPGAQTGSTQGAGTGGTVPGGTGAAGTGTNGTAGAGSNVIEIVQGSTSGPVGAGTNTQQPQGTPEQKPDYPGQTMVDNTVNYGPGTNNGPSPEGTSSTQIVGGNSTTTTPGGTTATPGGTTTPGGTATPGSTGTTTAPSAGQGILNPNAKKPELSSEAAVLINAATGEVLFSKNADKQMYPASITKLMTALLVAENAAMDATVTYQASAVENLESGAATVNMATGDTMSVKDSMYALMLKSACEVANGLAEHVSGSQQAFAQKMNERAAQLGCKSTHFTNASGLNDTQHLTTAYDMALITRAALQNDTVRAIAQTPSYTLPASKNRGKLTIYNGNKMLSTANEQYYQGIVGGKTGYTSKAGNTFAAEASRNGITLVAVVMKSKSKHYVDTKALFDYGFALYTAPGSNAGNGSSSANTTTQNGAGKWQADGNKWKFVKANGSYAKSEWVDINNNSYYIGSDGYMITGWQKFSNGAYYYFDENSGAMLKNSWKNEGTGSNIKSYYLQADGTMAVNKVVDTKQGKYRVDANGVAVEKLS